MDCDPTVAPNEWCVRKFEFGPCIAKPPHVFGEARNYPFGERLVHRFGAIRIRQPDATLELGHLLQAPYNVGFHPLLGLTTEGEPHDGLARAVPRTGRDRQEGRFRPLVRQFHRFERL
jgi:hypothetical protein